MTGARPILRYPPMPVYCRQHGLGLFDALVMLTEGEPWPCRLTKARQFQAPDQLPAGIVEDGKGSGTSRGRMEWQGWRLDRRVKRT